MSRFSVALFVLALVAFSHLPALAASPAIAGVVLDAAGGANSGPAFTVGVSPPDGRWAAGSYQVTIELMRVETDEIVARSRWFAGDADVDAGQTAFVAIVFDTPLNVTGVFAVRARLEHNSRTVDENDETAIALGTVAASADRSVTGAAREATAELTSTANFRSQASRTFALNLANPLSPTSTVFANFGLSTVPNLAQNLIRLQGSGQQVQAGTFALDVDPLFLNGTSVDGASFERAWANTQKLKVLYVESSDPTANPYDIAALNYSARIGPGVAMITTGQMHVTGVLDDTVPVFLRDGFFAGASYRVDRPAGITYDVRYGLVTYRDDASQTMRTDRMIEANTEFSTATIVWTIGFNRTGTFFPNLAAPEVTPDREAVRAAFRAPLGRLSVSGSVEGTRDGLDADFSVNPTNGWREQLQFAYPLGAGSNLRLGILSAVDHGDGFVGPLDDLDDTRLSYATRIREYVLTADIESINTRKATGVLAHATKDSIGISRDTGSGFGFSTDFSLNNRTFNDVTQTEIYGAGTTSVSYTRGIFSLSAGQERSLTRPYLGDAGAPLTVLEYALRVRPTPQFPYGLLMSVGLQHGFNSSTVGALNLSRAF